MQQFPTLPCLPGAASVTLCVARLQDIAVADARGLLSTAEIERAERITHRDTRLQFMRTRALLRLLLAHCTGGPPRNFALVDGGGEAPRLADNPWGLHFNVSHSHEWAAVAVARSPLGIDLERIDAECGSEPIAENLFHAREQARLKQARSEARLGLFFEIWTRKEAYLKGIGVGLSQDPASFHTTSPDGAVVSEGEPASRGTWYTLPICAPDGYRAALASNGPAPAIDRVNLANLVRNFEPARGLGTST
jgi:4'-phosphopantetheinyl transferase